MAMLIPKCPACGTGHLECLNPSALKPTYRCVCCGIHWLLDLDTKTSRRVLVKYDQLTGQIDSSVSAIVPEMATVNHSTWVDMCGPGAGVGGEMALDDLKKRIADGDVVYLTDSDNTTVIAKLVLEGDRLKQVPPDREEQ